MSLRHLAICLLFVGLPLSQSRLAADELPVWTPIGPDGGVVRILAVSPVLPNEVLAGVPFGFGIFRSADRARSWQAATDMIGQTVHDLAINANGRTFYAATSRGLWRSTDGGLRWPALDPDTGGYSLVAAHPRKPALVLAVKGGVLLRSTDRGVTRTAVEGPQGIAAITFAPAGPRPAVYAGGRNGLWRSIDDGRTWTDVSPSLVPSPRITAVAVDPVNPRILYIGLQRGQRVLLKSKDGGATWRPSQKGLPSAGGTFLPVPEIAVDPRNPSTVYAVAGGKLFRSLDGGRVWSRSLPPSPGSFVHALKTTGYGVLAGTETGVLLSLDRGLTWQARNSGLTAVTTGGMTIDGQDRLYATGVSGRIYRTTHQGRPWMRLGEPAGSSFVGQLSVADPGTLYAVADNGIFKSTDDGRTWNSLSLPTCVSFVRLALDPRVPDHVFLSGFVNPLCPPETCTLFRSPDAGETWECLDRFRSILFGDPLLGVDPFSSAIYAQLPTGELLRSADGGQTWASLGLFDRFSSFLASPLVEGRLWAGTQRGAVLRSRDGGSTWETFATGSGDFILDLAEDPTDSSTLYAASAFNGVFKSADSGETWSIAGIWPPSIIFRGKLLVDPGDPAIVYAGADVMGVLRLDQSGD